MHVFTKTLFRRRKRWLSQSPWPSKFSWFVNSWICVKASQKKNPQSLQILVHVSAETSTFVSVCYKRINKGVLWIVDRQNNYKEDNRKNLKSVRGKNNLVRLFSRGSSLKSSCVISIMCTASLLNLKKNCNNKPAAEFENVFEFNLL